MKSKLNFAQPLVLWILCMLSTMSFHTAQAADGDRENPLIAILESKDSSLQQKDAACAQLKRIGSAQSVPALASLLADENLSHSARYALESMPYREAGTALISGLDKSKGLIRAGIINSLANRRENAATPALIKLLKNGEPSVAASAAIALGKISGSQAVEALNSALPNAQGGVKSAVMDAMLIAANQLCQQGDSEQAFAIYQSLYKTADKDFIRVGAYGGMIRSSGSKALELIEAALSEEEGCAQIASIQSVRNLDNSGVTPLLVRLLPKASPVLQTSIIDALNQRGDANAAVSIIDFAKSPSIEVRTAALNALGNLGNEAALTTLAEACGGEFESERKAARRSLIQLRGNKIGEMLITLLPPAKPSVQIELVKILEARAEKSTLPNLLELALSSRQAARSSALKALGQMGTQAEFEPLVKGLAKASDASLIESIQAALDSICQRLRSVPNVDYAPLAAGISQGASGTRSALMQVASNIKDARIREALRAALAETNPDVKAAAIRATCNSIDPDLLPDILKLAQNANASGIRTMAIRGVVRLVAEEENNPFTMAQRAMQLRQISTLAQPVEEKRQVLSGLSRVADPEALKMAQSYLTNKELESEARQAVLQISSAIHSAHAAVAVQAIKNVLAMGVEPSQRKSAEAILKKIDDLAGYITAWQVAGPYLQDGVNFDVLFDKVFPPEKARSANIQWKSLAAADPGKPWFFDLLKALGGNQRVAYVRCRIYADKMQSIRLDIGSDDGMKVWLNGRLIHSNNASRGYSEGSDKIYASLKQGWNPLLLKITQNTLGWEFSARIVKPNGAKLDGIRFDADFASASDAAPGPQHAKGSWTWRQLDSQFRSEGVAVADFNRDGNPDIATGNTIYWGPNWTMGSMLDKPVVYNPEGYSQEFYCFASDINKDTWPDLIVIGFPGAQTSWLENPGQKGGPWPRHLAIEKTGNESPDWVDLDNDGHCELVFVSERGMAFAQPGSDPSQLWKTKVIGGDQDPRPGHGLGVGDINKDGKNDIVVPEGWWEAPAEKGRVPWTFHPAKLSESCAQMAVYDVDGDGDADIISSSAHNFGLWWCEQTASGWKMHEIDRSISQLHALHLADINHDGLLDIITGKRFWAHRQGDPGVDDPAILCWYELARKQDKVSWIRHEIDINSGVGLHFQIANLKKDGNLSVIISNKKGVCIFDKTAKVFP